MIHQIVGNMNDSVKTIIRKQMWRRPRDMPHAVWLEKIVERLERKDRARRMKNEARPEMVGRWEDAEIERQGKIRHERMSESMPEDSEKFTKSWKRG